MQPKIHFGAGSNRQKRSAVDIKHVLLAHPTIDRKSNGELEVINLEAIDACEETTRVSLSQATIQAEQDQTNYSR
jgi:hypothetical protein